MANEALQDLNKRVTEAIFRAEHAEPGSREEEAAYRHVSELEEQIGRVVAADQLEGALARVGAVTAALDAGDWLRASQLADSYLAGAPADLAEELKELLAEAEKVAGALVEPEVRPISFELRAA